MATGWPAVEQKCAELDISFRPWQVGAGRLILAKRVDGKYASTVGGTGLSIPRQVGKTYLVAAIVFALCLLRPGMTVIWTAHRLRTAEETFGKMQVFAKRRKIAPHMLRPVLGSGEEEIRFRNGSRIMFGARERGFGRGFDEVDVLIFDEGQILTDAALDDMIPATNQSRNPAGALLLFMGTPPKPTDNGEAFKRMRAEALSGEDEDTGWIEFGADPGFVPTSLPAQLNKADWEQVAKANPSYPADTPREAILRMRKKLGSDSFLREGLGIWDEAIDAELAIDEAGWKDTTVEVDAAGEICEPGGEVEEWAAFGVAVAIDRSFSAIGSAGMRTDGLPHLELVQHDRGVGWVVERCIRLDADNLGATFVIDGGGPAASLIEPMQNAGLTVVVLTLKDVARACAWLADGVVERLLRHGPDPILAANVAATKWRNAGDQRVFGRRVSSVDISPLEAVTIAAHVLPSVVPLDDVTAAFI